MKIINLAVEDKGTIRQAAEMLVLVFKESAPCAWPDMPSAMQEVWGSLQEGRISRVAIGNDGEVLGWIGGIREYHGNAWELHPLVVHPDHQGNGIGSALVADLEELVRLRGGVTIYLGTDDEDGRTTLADIDLYPNLLEKIASIQNPGRHPYEFYQKLGYTIVGVIPDANGFGKPDILMAKRVASLTGCARWMV